jgi:hypothetical protein
VCTKPMVSYCWVDSFPKLTLLRYNLHTKLTARSVLTNTYIHFADAKTTQSVLMGTKLESLFPPPAQETRHPLSQWLVLSFLEHHMNGIILKSRWVHFGVWCHGSEFPVTVIDPPLSQSRIPVHECTQPNLPRVDLCVVSHVGSKE